MADEEEEYESDPEQSKLSLKMRRRTVASDDEEDEDDDDDNNNNNDVRVSSRVSDYDESDEQGAPYDDYGDYDDDVADEELVEEVVVAVERENDDRIDNVDGGEGEGEGEGGEKKENEPFAVPTAGAFYMHDDRTRGSSGGGARNR